MTKWGNAGTVLLLALLAIPLAGQESSTKKKKTDKRPTVASANAEDSKPVSATTDPGYVIGAQDELYISVWKEPDVTRTVPVRPDGKISLPLINDIQAAGLTPVQLAALLTEKLSKYLTEPQVTVIVTATNSRRIFIMGEVGRPGAYALLPDMTILQALSGAGGFSQFANLKGIYVLRNENGKQVKYPFNYKEVIKGERPQQNILLKPGDTVVVP